MDHLGLDKDNRYDNSSHGNSSAMSMLNDKLNRRKSINDRLKFKDEFAIFTAKTKAEALKDLALMEAEKK